MTKPIKKLTISKKENAQTMVEFALVFPIILLITYGLIEFGRMMLIYTSVTGATREGARYGATAFNYQNCEGIWNATSRLLFLVPDEDIIASEIGYDNGPPASTSPDLLCAADHETYVGPDELSLGDRIVVHLEVAYHPLIGSFLGVTGFDIPSTNYRTTLIDVPIPYP